MSTRPHAGGARRPPKDPARPPAAEALAASERRYRRLFETAKDGILILDATSGMVVDANPFLTELLGYNRDWFVGKTIWELGFLKDAIASRDRFLELQQRRYVRYEDLPLETASGRRVDVEFVSNVYMVGQQEVIQCNIRDITARKLAETRQELSMQVLATLNRSTDTASTVGEILRLVKASTRIEAAGIRLRQGEDFPYFAHDGFSGDFLAHEDTLACRTEAGGVCRNPDGSLCLECTCGLVLSGRADPASPLFSPGGSFWTNDALPLLDIPADQDPRLNPRNRCIRAGFRSVALIPLRSGDATIGLLQLNDHRPGCFTLEMVQYLERLGASIAVALARQQAERDLRSKSAFLDSLLEAMPVPVFYKDAQGCYLGFNRAFEVFHGKTRAELTGKTVFDIAPRELAAAYRAKDLELLRAPGTQVYDATMVDGQGQTHDVVFHKATFRSPEGEVAGLIGVILDITARVRAEVAKARLEAQLRQAQKMDAVGRLAGGVAHDFNNLLMGIMNYVELCRDGLPPGHPVRCHLDVIMSDAQRSAEITRQLLGFARKQDIAPQVLDLNDTVAGMLPLLRRLIGEDVGLTWLAGAGLGLVRIDPAQVHQILANLCANARDAIAGVGRITLQTGCLTLSAEDCARQPGATPGVYVTLAVGDNGCGMDAATMAQVFEPFFTTKGIGQGTGLGLATVYGIVVQNSGFILAQSEPGRGSTFTIHLPLLTVEPVTATASPPAAAPRGRGETVLLVEDERSPRVTCGLFLEGLGYHVLAAETPGEAIKLCQRHRGDIDLLLTDVVMPGMDGRQLAQRIAALRPGVKVLFMSGYTADVVAQRGVLEQNMAFIGKPFGRADLARKVHEVLGGGARPSAGVPVAGGCR